MSNLPKTDPDPLFAERGTTSVVNIKSGADYDVYIGRANAAYGLEASKWANPFRLTNEAERGLVLARYRIWLHTQPRLLADIHELRGYRLGCYCHPSLCHGDYLAELANAPDRERRARVGATWASPIIEAYWRDEVRRGSPALGRLIQICQDLGWHYPTVVEELRG